MIGKITFREYVGVERLKKEVIRIYNEAHVPLRISRPPLPTLVQREEILLPSCFAEPFVKIWIVHFNQ